jgi:hypothetical protein
VCRVGQRDGPAYHELLSEGDSGYGVMVMVHGEK